MKIYNLTAMIVILTLSISCTSHERGEFISIELSDGNEFRAYSSGPDDSNAGIMIVHDWFGISDFTKESVERLGSLGYRVIAVDLYRGSSATTHKDAGKLMGKLVRAETDEILQSGLDHLKMPGRKLATIGFSMGGMESLNANLNDPEAVNGTVIIYGGGFDKLDAEMLMKLKSPVFTITGSEDGWSLPAATIFLENMKKTWKSSELYVYPGAAHAYAQPLYNEGQNYDAEATRITWLLVEDFLKRIFSQN